MRTSPSKLQFFCDIPETATATICPLDRFHFLQDLSLEEREALTRGVHLPSDGEPSSEEAPRGPEKAVEVEEAPTSSRDPPPGFRNAPHRPVVTANPSIYILDEDWSQNYLTSEEFKQSWLECHDPDTMWPHDVQLLQGKLYKGGKLYKPEDRVEAMLLAYHVGSGHPGQKRLLVASRTQFIFPSSAKVKGVTRLIRTNCPVCQACESPNLPQQKKLRMNPVIEGFWASVCLGVFFHATHRVEGRTF